MTGRRQTRQRSASGGRGFFLCILLLLVACVLKYADTPLVRNIREKTAEVLAGTPGLEDALAVLGGEEEDAGLQEVFAPQGTTKSSAIDEFDYAISSGGADDILGREKTLFPDAVDETVYPMEFLHVLPSEGMLSSNFGSRLSPITGQPGFHYGIDVAADEGEKIGAFANGTVREVGESSYGKYIIVDHEEGFSTLYAHCSSISAEVGQIVKCEEEIARVGQTGNATGPHLHLELWKDGAALNPSNYLTEA